MRVTSSQAGTTNAPFVPHDPGARPRNTACHHIARAQFAELRAWEVFDGCIRRFALALALPLLAATVAAQGVQTGEMSGTVSSSDGLTLPGASVSVQGPALQKVRTLVTDVNGTYVVRALPPGTYTLTFAMSGLTTRTETVVVELDGRP